MKIELLPFETYRYSDSFILASSHSLSHFVCDADLYAKIQAKQIDEDLAMKLFQMGFCKIDDQLTTRAFTQKQRFSPSFFLIDLTTKCNLGCVYCFRDTVGTKISSSTLHEILDYIHEYCASNNVPEIQIQPWGGEPLLAFDRICEIHEYFATKPENCIITLETNGTCITPKIAQKLKDMECRIGVSLDGTPEIHNLNRPKSNGAPSYELVARGINALKDAGYRADQIGLLLVLTRNNVNHIDKIIDHYIDQFGLTGIKINPVIFNEQMENDAVCITPTEYANVQARVLEKMIELWRQGIYFSEANVTTKAQNILSSHSGSICGSRGCQAGYKMIAFDAVGNIYPCDVTDHKELSVGNIADDIELTKLLEKSLSFSPFFTSTLDDRCKQCTWLRYCGGGCHTARFYRRGDFSGLDEFECESNKVMYPALLETLLQDEQIKEYLARRQ